MTHTNYYKKGDHWVICDICGSRQWRSECKFTWDGLLACITNDCWYPKHAGDEPLPVINDPKPVLDARPDLPMDQLNFLEEGHLSTWNHVVNPRATSGRITWNAYHRKFGSVDNPDDLTGA